MIGLRGAADRLESLVRHSIYPRWVTHLVGHMICLRDQFNRYPLASEPDTLSCRPVFIISMGRSGTTLLRSMLVAGGQIAIPPESCVIPAAIREYGLLQNRDWPALSSGVIGRFEAHRRFHVWEADLGPAHRTAAELGRDRRSLAQVLDEVFKCYGAAKFPRASHWGDQTTLNTFYVSWLLLVFPEARFIHLVRDARDAIASLIEYRQAIQTAVPRPRQLARATRRWNLSVREALWLQQKVDDGQFLGVRYEQLVQEPARTLSQVSDFLALEPRVDQMLRFWQMETTVEHKYFDHHKNLQRPVFTSSVGSWRRRLDAAEQEYVLSKTADLLGRLNYL